MKMRVYRQNRRRKSAGLTLVEIMVATGLGSLVLGIVATVFITSLHNFAGLGNYAELTGQSRMSLDRISREIRESSRVLGAATNGTVKSLILSNSMTATIITLNWDSATQVLEMQKTGEPDSVFLTGCEAWDFSFFQRSPKTGWTFYPTTDYRLCKLINMSWKCLRTVGNRVNSETVVTSQVVLRNKG